MEAPPTWFDFSTECIYTAQKHKKNKSWKDGLCICCFVRGWVILRLYPEGASSASEPLEEWRIPPDCPASVAQKEIEFQIHLVQLLGSPRPLGSKQPFYEAEEVQKSSLPSHSVASGPDLQGLAPRGGAKALPKRRLPGGLFRPNGVSPTGPVKQSATQIRDTGLDYPPTRERSLNHFNKENRENRSATGSYATFVPPFRQQPEELPCAPQPLSFEKAWIVNGARATLSSTCFCCGQSQCHYLLSRSSGSACSAASSFRQLFDGARSPGVLLPEQAVE